MSATSGSDEATTYLTVFNGGTSAASIAVSFESSSSSTVSVESVTPRTLAPGSYMRIAIDLAGLRQLTSPVSGQFIVDGDGVPSSRPATIAPAPQPFADWPAWIVGGSLVAIVVLMLAIRRWARKKDKLNMLGKPAPGPKWSFDSWATTSTALGALLGVVLGSSLLPDVPRQIAKDSLIGLNLVFGGMVVVAPFLFQAIRTSNTSADDQDAGLWGYNWALALACSITGGAVLGELATLALASWEITGSDVWRYVVLLVLAILAVLAGHYFYVTACRLATTDWAALAKRDKDAAATVQRSSYIGPAGPTGEAPPAEAPIDVVVPRRAWSLP